MLPPKHLQAVVERGALVVLVITGWGLASHFKLWDSSTLHWKLALVALVIVLVLAHLRWAKLHALQGAILVASLVIGSNGGKPLAQVSSAILDTVIEWVEADEKRRVDYADLALACDIVKAAREAEDEREGTTDGE